FAHLVRWLRKEAGGQYTQLSRAVSRGYRAVYASRRSLVCFHTHMPGLQPIYFEKEKPHESFPMQLTEPLCPSICLRPMYYGNKMIQSPQAPIEHQNSHRILHVGDR